MEVEGGILDLRDTCSVCFDFHCMKYVLIIIKFEVFLTMKYFYGERICYLMEPEFSEFFHL